MGNSLSPFLSEIFLSRFEEQLSSNNNFPRFWRRYVDDVFAVVPTRQARSTLDWLNSSEYTSLQFTMEIEEENKLPFLDVMTTKLDDGTLNFKPYRKPSSSLRTITNDSNHDQRQKTMAYHSLAHRLVNLPMTPGDFKEEERLIFHTGDVNGFPKTTIRQIVDKHKRKRRLADVTSLTPITVAEENDQEKTVWGRLSYDSNISRGVKPLMKRFNVRLAHRSQKLRSHFKSPKDPTPDKNKSGIYEISCGEVGCQQKYVGQTKRSIITRFKEHVRNFRDLDEEKSAVAKHMMNERHVFDETQLRLLKQVNENSRLSFWANLEIWRRRNCLMNLDPLSTSKLLKLVR